MAEGVMTNSNNRPTNEDKKPIFWEVEDGESISVDPKNIHKCRVCGSWYKSKILPDVHKICSPGCSLKLAETKGHVSK
jgi:hypothetical protein